jgi:hypothetical protein
MTNDEVDDHERETLSSRVLAWIETLRRADLERIEQLEREVADRYEQGYRDGESSRLADLMLAADHAETAAELEGAPDALWIDGDFADPDTLKARVVSAHGGVEYVRADIVEALIDERDELQEASKKT